jgi:hypothetical protein
MPNKENHMQSSRDTTYRLKEAWDEGRRDDFNKICGEIYCSDKYLFKRYREASADFRTATRILKKAGRMVGDPLQVEYASRKLDSFREKHYSADLNTTEPFSSKEMAAYTLCSKSEMVATLTGFVISLKTDDDLLDEIMTLYPRYGVLAIVESILALKNIGRRSTLIGIPESSFNGIRDGITSQDFENSMEQYALSSHHIGALMSITPSTPLANNQDMRMHSLYLGSIVGAGTESEEVVIVTGSCPSPSNPVEGGIFHWIHPTDGQGPEGQYLAMHLQPRYPNQVRYPSEISDDGELSTHDIPALWAFSQTNMVEARRWNANASTKKKKKGRYANAATDIQVVTLRRIVKDASQGNGHAGTGSPHTVRYDVKSHWRTLPNGRRIRVSGHQRGPKDAPMQPTRERVYVLDRVK